MIIFCGLFPHSLIMIVGYELQRFLEGDSQLPHPASSRISPMKGEKEEITKVNSLVEVTHTSRGKPHRQTRKMRMHGCVWLVTSRSQLCRVVIVAMDLWRGIMFATAFELVRCGGAPTLFWVDENPKPALSRGCFSAIGDYDVVMCFLLPKSHDGITVATLARADQTRGKTSLFWAFLHLVEPLPMDTRPPAMAVIRSGTLAAPPNLPVPAPKDAPEQTVHVTAFFSPVANTMDSEKSIRHSPCLPLSLHHSSPCVWLDRSMTQRGNSKGRPPYRLPRNAWKRQDDAHGNK